MKRYLRTRTAVKQQTKTNYNFVVNLLKKEEFCSNQAKAGMNPKTLQYLMGHSEIGVTIPVPNSNTIPVAVPTDKNNHYNNE